MQCSYACDCVGVVVRVNRSFVASSFLSVNPISEEFCIAGYREWFEDCSVFMCSIFLLMELARTGMIHLLLITFRSTSEASVSLVFCGLLWGSTGDKESILPFVSSLQRLSFSLLSLVFYLFIFLFFSIFHILFPSISPSQPLHLVSPRWRFCL